MNGNSPGATGVPPTTLAVGSATAGATTAALDRVEIASPVTTPVRIPRQRIRGC
jgi:hypothetical protein